jgi:hypothetical protein
LRRQLTDIRLSLIYRDVAELVLVARHRRELRCGDAAPAIAGTAVTQVATLYRLRLSR